MIRMSAKLREGKAGWILLWLLWRKRIFIKI